MTDADSMVENWYEHENKGQCFQIVATDEEKGIIEIQHFDGNVEEIELADWYRLDVNPAMNQRTGTVRWMSAFELRLFGQRLYVCH